MRHICLSAVVLALTAPLTAQGELDLTLCTGGIGKKVDYEIGGGNAFRPFLFFTSLQRGSFPLRVIDSRDTRSLGVGLDLLGLVVLAQFNNQGKAAFSLSLPNDTSLAGKALTHQAITFPGTSTFFGAMSQVAVVPLEVAGAWRDYPQFAMTDKRAWVGMIPLRDGRLLATGGGNGALLALTAVKSTERYDPVTRKFTGGPAMTQPRGVHRISELPDGRWILIGGVNQNNDPQKTCDYYDPKTDAFSVAPPMSKARMIHTATRLKDGRIIVAGGMQSLSGNTLQQLQSATSSTEIFDPKMKKWSSGPSLSEARAGHSATLLPDGRVVFVGGITLRTFLRLPDFSSTADVFDPSTNKITRLPGSFPKRAGQAAAVLPNGKLLIAGGVGGSILPNGGSALSSCRIYDFNAKSWSSVPSLTTARGLMSSVFTRDGKFVAVGGVKGSLLNPGAVPDVDSFDWTSNRWTRLPALRTSRATHGLVELGSCALFVLGGGSGQTGSALATQEILYRQ